MVIKKYTVVAFCWCGLGAMHHEVQQTNVMIHQAVVGKNSQQSLHHNNSEHAIVIPQESLQKFSPEYFSAEPLVPLCGVEGYCIGENPIKKWCGVSAGAAALILFLIYFVPH